MLTAVLDDDPTGTQSATGVTVLLDWDAPAIVDGLRAEGAVYLQTNSRAVTEAAAVALVTRYARPAAPRPTRVLGEPILPVLRGDSTLRGHVFAESDVFAGDAGCVLLVPAFPQAAGPRLAGCTGSSSTASTPRSARPSSPATRSSATAVRTSSTTSGRRGPARHSGPCPRACGRAAAPGRADGSARGGPGRVRAARRRNRPRHRADPRRVARGARHSGRHRRPLRRHLGRDLRRLFEPRATWTARWPRRGPACWSSAARTRRPRPRNWRH